MISIEEIKKFLKGEIKLREPLAKYTSLRIGGAADCYLEPADKDDLVNVIRYVQRSEVPFFIIGNGSNVLISDEGYRGVVINLEARVNRLEVRGDIVEAEAGVRTPRLVDFCIQRGLQGVEMLVGIPGTIGGAVVINAGAHGGQISDYLVEVEVFREGEVIRVTKELGDFAYRRSGFVRDVVLGAAFRLLKGNKEEMMRRRREFLVIRGKTQPLNFPNSGSIFKNPPGTYAAKLIEKVGLKGVRRGDAQISELHANFFINLGGAKATDVLELMRTAREAVFRKFDITLEPEVKLVGFSTEFVTK
ncbi:MAG: UDP-N-acetylmuramate dehydrogenase [Bacteroidota bacterium]